MGRPSQGSAQPRRQKGPELKRRLYTRETARRDLLDHFVYLATESSLDTAERFLSNAEQSFNEILGQPLMGTPLLLKPPELAGLRKWRVHKFPNHLIFYQPRSDGVSIVRVLHARRDWWSLLGIEAE